MRQLPAGVGGGEGLLVDALLVEVAHQLGKRPSGSMQSAASAEGQHAEQQQAQEPSLPQQQRRMRHARQREADAAEAEAEALLPAGSPASAGATPHRPVRKASSWGASSAARRALSMPGGAMEVRKGQVAPVHACERGHAGAAGQRRLAALPLDIVCTMHVIFLPARLPACLPAQLGLTSANPALLPWLQGVEMLLKSSSAPLPDEGAAGHPPTAPRRAFPTP